jgi:hypothetical protein
MAALEVQLLADATGAAGTSSATAGTVPSLATHGVAIAADPMTEYVLMLFSTAGSGVMTGTFRVWGYHPTPNKWFPLGTSSTEANRGVLNEQNAVDEDGADILIHAEPLASISAFTRLYIQITTIGGVGTTVSAYLIGR